MAATTARRATVPHTNVILALRRGCPSESAIGDVKNPRSIVGFAAVMGTSVEFHDYGRVFSALVTELAAVWLRRPAGSVFVYMCVEFMRARLARLARELVSLGQSVAVLDMVHVRPVTLAAVG